MPLTFLGWYSRLDFVVDGLEGPVVVHAVLTGLHIQRDPAGPETGTLSPVLRLMTTFWAGTYSSLLNYG